MACCGDTPTLETLAATSILREYFPELRIRVVNVVDLMRLQSNTEHPHGLTDEDYDALFTKNKPIIFAFHGYPNLVHQLTYNESRVIPKFPTCSAIFTGIRLPHTSLSWSIWYPGKRLLTSASLISAIAVRVGRLSLLLRL